MLQPATGEASALVVSTTKPSGRLVVGGKASGSACNQWAAEAPLCCGWCGPETRGVDVRCIYKILANNRILQCNIILY